MGTQLDLELMGGRTITLPPTSSTQALQLHACPKKTFDMLFKNKLPKRLPDNMMFRSASGTRLEVFGTFEIPINIRGKQITHPFRVMENLSDNLIGIDFMHKHGLYYDPRKRIISFDDGVPNSLTCTKDYTIEALTSQLITVHYHGMKIEDNLAIATVFSPKNKFISGEPGLIKIDSNNCARILVNNCAPFDIKMDRKDIIGWVEHTEETNPLELNDQVLSSVISDIQQRLPKVPQKKYTKEEIKNTANLNVPASYKTKYVDLLHKYQDTISKSKADLGRAKNFVHKIHLKDNNPVYRKQFKIPEAHTDFIEQTVEEWLKLGVVRRANSLYNSPIFCVPKKEGRGLRIVQDFRGLNEKTHVDKYSMKEITECIGDIGRANSTIFSTLDLTSGFWQMPLDNEAAKLTAFTIPGKGQFEWITSPMGLLGCPASFQRLMEQVLRNISNVIVYIDDLLIHTDTHEKHLQTLEQVLARLKSNNLKINLDKCIFGNPEVSYLGFLLTPQGIKPGRNKLKAIEKAKPPVDVKTIRSFLGLCNFFRTHIKDFSIIAAPLFKATRKDSAYKGGQLPPDALKAFYILQKQLVSDPIVQFPRSDRKYALITDASTGTATIAGGLGAILTQIDKEGRFHVISYASRQLKDHEKNYSPYLAEAAAIVWGIETFEEYLRGKNFVVYTDHKPLEKMGHLHKKALNRLEEKILEHGCVLQYKKGINMPADFLSRQIHEEQVDKISDYFKPAELDTIDPFKSDLRDLQMKDKDLQLLNTFLNTGKWDNSMQKQHIKRLEFFVNRVFQDKHKIVWVRIYDNNYPRTALWLPEKYRKQAICDAHDHIFGGHNAALKTYIKISTSYCWPRMYSDILMHTKSCLRCQSRKTSTNKPPPLHPLPIPDMPNQRIHADLFGPLIGSDKRKKHILCITDAFTKYAIVCTVDNKEAETVAGKIFEEWFCKFGLPAQIHTDGGKEFVNKLSDELFILLNVDHTKTSPAHPQCNSQVEVFNKTVKKYLSSFTDKTTHDWETFIPSLNLAYNTSYHSTIQTTPFELLFGMKPRLPSFPNPDIERVHYGEDFASERLQILNKARQIAREHSEASKATNKTVFDRDAKDHSFKIGDKVLYTEMTFAGRNQKLAPKWLGPAEIIDLNETNAKIKTDKGKIKLINIMRIKLFIETQTETETEESNDPIDFPLTREGPMTRARQKLIKEQLATAEAIKNLINKKDAQILAINLINEALKPDLMRCAYKLLHSDTAKLEDLTPEEQTLWNSFENRDIYELLTGDPDEIPNFQWDWINCDSTVYRAKPEAQIPQQQPPVVAPAAPQPPQPPPAPPLPVFGPQPRAQRQRRTFGKSTLTLRPRPTKEKTHTCPTDSTEQGGACATPTHSQQAVLESLQKKSTSIKSKVSTFFSPSSKKCESRFSQE